MVGSRGSSEVGELFRLHGPVVFRRAFRLLGRREDAEEATQEVFIRVMRGIEGFDHRSGITTWLYQITTNYCLNFLRDRGRRRDLFAQHMAPPEEESRSPVADLVLLRRLLSEADEQQARAAVYVYLDGMSHEEAAELLGVSKRTVGNLIERFLTWAQKRSAALGPAATAAPAAPAATKTTAGGADGGAGTQRAQAAPAKPGR
ncbi:MAG: RNA polymerase sigma factor [Polyangia bacterium]